MARRYRPLTRTVRPSCPPPWLWIFAGVLIGASLTVMGYVYGIIPAPQRQPVVATPPPIAVATVTATATATATATPVAATPPTPATAVETSTAPPPTTAEHPAEAAQIPRFEFYETLLQSSRDRQPTATAITNAAPMRPEDFPPALESIDDATPAASPSGQFMLQVASFRSQQEALQLESYLADLGFKASIQTATLSGETWFRTRVGPYATQHAAEQARIQLSEHQFKAIFVPF